MQAARQQRSTPERVTAGAAALIGRDDVLDSIVDATSEGSSLVVVEGEAGIGKTRLLREMAGRLEGARAGDRVLMATCPPVVEPSPLGAVVAGIRRLLPRLDGLALSPLAGALRPLFPEWSAELPPALEPQESPGAVRQILFRALSEVIDRLGVTVVVVEDVHWADTATLEWLLTMCAEQPADGRRLSIVVSYRPWDVQPGSLLPRLTGRAPVGRARLRVELGPLTTSDIRRLVGSWYSTDDVSEHFAAFLHDATDGIPLVIEEYLLLLEDRDDIVRQNGGWIRRMLSELEVPATVRESVLERVHRLDHDTRRVLEAASVLAEPADEALLALVADLGEEAVRTGLAGALGSGLLREHAPGLFAFRHVSDAQAIGEAVPVSERRRLHARAATVLEQHDHPPMARLAHHFREAGDTGHWARYAEASADLALESGDDRTAVETLLHVLDITDQPIDGRVTLARKLGEAAFFGAAALGDLSGQVVEALRSVLDAGEIARGDRGELRLLLGRMLWAVGEKPAAFEQWELAVPDLGHRPDLAIRAMSNLALPLIPTWSAARHRQWLDLAGAIVDQVAPVDRLAHLRMRITAQLLLGEEEGWETLASFPRTASTPAEGRALASALVNAALAMLAWGRFDDARRHLDAGIQQIENADYSRLAHHADTARALLDWSTGAWAGLEARAAGLVATSDVDPPTRLQARQVLGLLKMAGGDTVTARHHLVDVVAGYARMGVDDPAVVAAPAALARLHLAEAEPGRALAITEPVVDQLAAKGVWMWVTDIAPVHVDALVAVGRHRDAEEFVSRFGQALGDRVIPAPAAALATCRAAVTGADARSMAGLFAAAADRWSSMPRPYDALLCRERQGQALVAAGEQEQALAVLTACQRGLFELGARWDADRVAQLVREQGGEVPRAWRGGRRGYGDRLSPRELDVVRLVARGMTNKQVAASLFLSTRTVEGHVKSAMRKLEAGTRTALALAAVEGGYVDPDTDDPVARG